MNFNDTQNPIPYEQLQRKVSHHASELENLETFMNESIATLSRIVQPPTSTSAGHEGLVRMYNPSSGLRLDDSKRLCIAPADEDDINEGTSHNKPIVPLFMPYAMQRYGDNFKVVVLSRNAVFEIKPGMIALIFPWKSYGAMYDGNHSKILDTSGTTIVFSTDPIDGYNNMTNDGAHYQMAAICVAGITSTSNHNTYTIKDGYCYFHNSHNDTSGTGNAYIYYLG